MKKHLLFLITLFVCLSFSACKLKIFSDELERKPEEIIGTEPISKLKDENDESLQDKKDTSEITPDEPAEPETPEPEPDETTVPETPEPDPVETTEPESPSAASDDFQAGIPEEYRLKQNVPPGWNDPLPTSEGKADFFSSTFFGNMTGGSAQESLLPDLETLVTAEALEAFFGKKIIKTENQDNEVARIKQRTYTFEPSGSGEPYLTLGFSQVNSTEDAEMIMSIFSAKAVENPIGVKTTMYNFFGITGIYVLTENNVVIQVSGNYLEDQNARLLEFAKFVFERYTALP